MEPSNETSVNEVIRRWRAGLADTETMPPTDLDELEAHLRDAIDRLASTGLSPDEAFLVASRRLGTATGLTNEFAKINGHEIWLTRVLWMIGGVLVAMMLSKLSSAIANLGMLAGARLDLKASALGWFALGTQWAAMLGMIAVGWSWGERLFNRLGAAAVRAKSHSFLTAVVVLVALTLATGITLGSQFLTFRIVGSLEVGSVFVFRSVSRLLMPLMLWPAVVFWLLRQRARISTC
jgi:hypothetical protein